MRLRIPAMSSLRLCLCIGMGLCLWIASVGIPGPAAVAAVRSEGPRQRERADEAGPTGSAGQPDAPRVTYFRSLGWSDETVTVGAEALQPSRELQYHHDGTFEDAFCFQFGGVAPPYCGAFAEAYANRSEIHVIDDVVLWVTQVGAWGGQPFDLYVWEGGVSGPPGLVLHHASGRTLDNVPMWPMVAENHLHLGLRQPQGDFAVGYWADFSQSACTWYVAADRTGDAGNPWVDIAPGLGYPTGWQSPELLWPPPVRSLGIGMTVILVDTGVAEPDPEGTVLLSTWRKIKALYR
jgi:hypothetical protein